MKQLFRGGHLQRRVLLSATFWLLVTPGTGTAAPPDYSSVQALFTEHCLDCHASPDAEGQLVLENYETLMRGGEGGPSLVRSNSAQSLLVQFLEGKVERKGKKLIMPPGKRPKLKAEEIDLVKAWIDGGALPSAQPLLVVEPVIPKIVPTVAPRLPVKAIAMATQTLAIARHNEVELRQPENRALLRKLGEHRGSVNALVFSPDGKMLFSGAGEPGRFGEIRVWNVGDGKLIRTIQAHADAIYALAISPDGQVLASGSYDQKVMLWNGTTGEALRTLRGHNGAVFDLSFRRDGKILASASADRTVKLWDVASGVRRDTLAQSLKDVHSVAFSPDGLFLVAGGVDNRIRLYQVSSNAAETTNPLLEARFAHEGSILKVAFSPDGKTLASSADDRSVKVWETAGLKARLVLEAQPDWPVSLAFLGKNLVVGGLDGTVNFYDAKDGKVLLPPAPTVARVDPIGLQRGERVKLKVLGANLNNLREVKVHHPGLKAQLVESAVDNPGEVAITLSTETNLARGSYEFSLAGPGGESARVKIYVDDLPQINTRGTTNLAPTRLSHLPVSCWGTLASGGQADTFSFEVEKGQTLVFDVAAQAIASKLNAVLTLLDDEGRVLAGNNDFAGIDPLIVHTFDRAGRYQVRVADLMLAASQDHFYRLSLGSFPFVTGTFPLSIQRGKTSRVDLLGFNLPAACSLELKAEQGDELEVPVDQDRFRFRQRPKVLVSAEMESVEVEPNDSPAQATLYAGPGSISGRIGSSTRRQDADLFAFESAAGQTWAIETAAAQRGSPTDTKLELLYPDGRPVERVLLQATRNSAITFRAIDSVTADARVDNWEEMELNQYLYLQGEVVKIFRMPQGPDSGFLFYTANGKRRGYFDTTSTAHPLDEPCYVVEPVPVGTPPRANGLPAFMLNYGNDDDGERKLGTDSKLLFKAERAGKYLVRVTDARNFGGDLFVYRLVIRPAQPDFEVALAEANLTVPRGSGQSFSVQAKRQDGFQGAISVTARGLPSGWTVSSPLVIEAGHSEAKGTFWAAPDSPDPGPDASKMLKIQAVATVEHQTVVKELKSFGSIKLAPKPKLLVYLRPDTSTRSSTSTNSEDGGALTILAGQTISAILGVTRSGHDDLITFSVENLPHGVIVDNIGLNGVLIPKGQDERQIFINAAKWVPETDRFCYAVENQAGRQTSPPVLLRVRRPAAE